MGPVNTCTNGVIMLNTRHYLVFVMIACLIFGQACSQFTPTVDVDEIASTTGELIAEVEHGLEFDDVILLIRYVDDEGDSFG